MAIERPLVFGEWFLFCVRISKTNTERKKSRFHWFSLLFFFSFHAFFSIKFVYYFFSSFISLSNGYFRINCRLIHCAAVPYKNNNNNSIVREKREKNTHSLTHTHILKMWTTNISSHFHSVFFCHINRDDRKIKKNQIYDEIKEL